MRLLTFEYQGSRRVGVRAGGSVVDVSRVDPDIPPDLVSLLEAGPAALAAAVEASERGEGIDAGAVRVVAPIQKPEKVLCIGLNYADHAAESNMPIPSEPVVFSKFSSTIIGPGDAIRLPSVTQSVDYEVELVVVIGTAGKNIPESDALDHVAGYTVGHDVSARDFQLEKPGGQWLLGKTFDTFAPLGPDIVTSDEIDDPHNLGIRCILNGETVQDSTTAQLIFRIDQLIAYLSRVVTLQPGDLIFTGTPPGVGMARQPQLWLKAGDTVVCEIDGIGRLENPVVSG
ncbi:MAG: fumarylacetoacetate hydrolase family protein [Candidatus Latescibacteria bacterium]|nr:fumarylacetoacetate hydrolase family protein [Candidatus Latescibacterota bacterium]